MNFAIPSPRRRGFLLLEMILALAVFGAAATGLTIAMHRMGKVASLAQSELRITRMMQSALDEALSQPMLEEGEVETESGSAGNEVKFLTSVKLIEDMENEDGQLLQDMYHIEVRALWKENGQRQERSVETWRYGRMYQPL
jgi:hypothetical protein